MKNRLRDIVYDTIPSRVPERDIALLNSLTLNARLKLNFYLFVRLIV